MRTLPDPEASFENYRPLVENNDVALPILLFAGDTEVGAAAMEVDENVGFQPVLSYALHKMSEDLGQARWVVVSMEAFTKSAAATDWSPNEHQPGGLQRAHEAGDTSVRDCVSIAAVASDGARWSYVRIFTRTESGILWEEPIISWTDDCVGGVIDLLMHAVR